MIVLTGKSGAGKTTFAKILEKEHGLRRAITCTTRSPREGEEDGKDYHFLSEEECFPQGVLPGQQRRHHP